MRTSSARILLGFAALTTHVRGDLPPRWCGTWGIVEDEIVLIGKGFVPLAPGSRATLARRQEDLKTYVEERFTDESNPQVAKRTLAQPW